MSVCTSSPSIKNSNELVTTLSVNDTIVDDKIRDFSLNALPDASFVGSFPNDSSVQLSGQSTGFSLEELKNGYGGEDVGDPAVSLSSFENFTFGFSNSSGSDLTNESGGLTQSSSSKSISPGPFLEEEELDSKKQSRLQALPNPKDVPTKATFQDLQRVSDNRRRTVDGSGKELILDNKKRTGVVGEGIERISKKCFGEDGIYVRSVRKSTNSDMELMSGFIAREERIVNVLKGLKGILQADFQYEKSQKKGSVHSMYTEYYNLGDLKSLMQKYDLSHEQKEKIATQLFEGLCSLFEKDVIHRDLKLDNILVRFKDENLEAVIADFGFSIQSIEDLNTCPKTSDGKTLMISPNVPPEELKMYRETLEYKRSEKTNVWQLALVLGLLYGNELPNISDDIKRFNACNTAEKGNLMFNFSSSIGEKVKEPLEKLIYKMLKINPNERISSLDARDEFQQIISRNKSESLSA